MNKTETKMLVKLGVALLLTTPTILEMASRHNTPANSNPVRPRLTEPRRASEWATFDAKRARQDALLAKARGYRRAGKIAWAASVYRGAAYQGINGDAVYREMGDMFLEQGRVADADAAFALGGAAETVRRMGAE